MNRSRLLALPLGARVRSGTALLPALATGRIRVARDQGVSKIVVWAACRPLDGSGWRLGVYAECAEARGQVVDPLRWRAVVCQRDACLAVPQRIAEGGAGLAC